MKEHPILFSGEMVRAILEGRKTQTRRVITPEPKWEESPGLSSDGNWCGRYRKLAQGGGDGVAVEVDEVRCRYPIGLRLWVRETWQYADWTEDGMPWVRYRADLATILHETTPEEWAERLENTWATLSDPANYQIDNRAADRRWRPSIHMPRWASRLTLEVVSVRVERLWDITEEGALAEGVLPLYAHGAIEAGHAYTAIPRFRNLWNSINEKRGFGWEKNPWVRAVEFKRLAA